MGCGGCGHDNEANAKFCSECGAPLMTRCGSCQAEQPPGAKFCNQCGSPISATSAPVGDAYASQFLTDASQFLTERTGGYLGVDRAMAAVRKEAARREWIDAES